MKGRIILQDLVGHGYLANDGSWVNQCQGARAFERLYLALLDGLNHSEKHLQIVWCFRNPALNIYLPVRAQDNDRLNCCEVCPLAGSTQGQTAS